MKNNIDPRHSARGELLAMIDEHLYANSRLRFFEMLSDIIFRNSRLYGNTQQCLSYKEEFYIIGDKNKRQPRPMNVVHGNLRAEFKEYLDEVKALELEKALVRGFIQKIMFITNKDSDYARILPVSLHGLISKIALYLDTEESVLSKADIELFQVENKKYIGLMKTRMAYNLIDPS
tara:strand:- start:2842 stop:3369 length:528 start_codon:yes stop_codon:yes gene_type:complete